MLYSNNPSFSDIEIGYQNRIRYLEDALKEHSKDSEVIRNLKENIFHLGMEINFYIGQSSRLTQVNANMLCEIEISTRQIGNLKRTIMQQKNIIISYELERYDISLKCNLLRNSLERLRETKEKDDESNTCKVIMVRTPPMTLKIHVHLPQDFMKMWNYNCDMSCWITPVFENHEYVQILLILYHPMTLTIESKNAFYEMIQKFWIASPLLRKRLSFKHC